MTRQCKLTLFTEGSFTRRPAKALPDGVSDSGQELLVNLNIVSIVVQ